MVKKLKAMAQSASNDHELAAAVKESAQHIWLAGLGAFAKAQEEGQKLFGALMKEGKTLLKRTLGATGDKVGKVSEQVSGLAEQLQKQAAGTWDKLETVFEQRVERALDRLGMPSRKEIAELTKQVEQLTEAVSQLPARSAQKKSAHGKVEKKSAPKKAAKKTVAKKASGKKR